MNETQDQTPSAGKPRLESAAIAASSAAVTVREVAPEGALFVPLAYGRGPAAEVVVQVGELVTRGQVIGRPIDGVGPVILAPYDGRVRAIDRAWVARRNWVPAIQISSALGSGGVPGAPAAGAESPASTAQVSEADAHDVLERLRFAGDVCDEEGEHLATAMRRCIDSRVTDVIIRCFDDEPGRARQAMLLGAAPATDQADVCHRLVRAAAVLGGAIRARCVWFAVDEADAALRQRLGAALAGRTASRPGRGANGVGMRIARVSAEYPQGHPVLLAKRLRGVETPPGASTRVAGSWVLSASTLLDTATFLEEGRPRLSATLAVTHAGESMQWYSVPLGMPLRRLLAGTATASGTRAVLGGWMSGVAAADDRCVIDGSVDAAWTFDQVPPRAEIPCVRCGECVSACPVGLRPLALYDRIVSGAAADPAEPPEACIECGRCSDVCVSHLPLAAAISGAAARAEPRRPSMLNPPQIATGWTYRQSLGAVWFALILPGLAGIVFFGPAAMKIIAVATLVAMVTEIAFWRAGRTVMPGNIAHAALMGFLLALTLPAGAPLQAAVLGSLVAVAFGKIAVGGLGRYLWHPALVGRVAVQFVFAEQLGLGLGLAQSAVLTPRYLVFGDVNTRVAVSMADYQGWARTRVPLGVHAILVERPTQGLRRFADGALPSGGDSEMLALLRDELPPWEDTLLGGVPGGIGETSGIVLIVAALFLVYRRALRWTLPFGIIAAAFITAAILPVRTAPGGGYAWFPGWTAWQGSPIGLAYILYHLTTGQLLLGVCLLAADSTVLPITARGQLVFGLGVGALTIFMRLYGLLDGECYWAILIMNTLVPAIDRATRPHVLGTALTSH